MKANGKKVFVGMSGGVDSSVSTALLKKAGYDVTGVFIKVWNPEWLPCGWKEERRDAMRVAAALDIPFMTLDLQDEYKKGVVDYMLDEYKRGRTPNPDVMCNKEIKFGSFLKKARELGADFIATGHYAQTKERNIPRFADSAPPSKGDPASADSSNNSNEGNLPLKGVAEGRGMSLFEGIDKNKDQSYFLWTLGQEELKHVLFPVGHLEKSEVRKLAVKFKLPTAEKKDSQGICFIGKVDMKEFLSHYIESKPGNILNEAGEIIGTHEGAVFYTIGQRHGFEISKKTPSDEPYYIIAKDVEKNVIKVSNKRKNNNELKTVTGVRIGNVNWISGEPDLEKTYGARLRYRQEKQEAKIRAGVVTFSSPQSGVSIGQSLVLYDGTMCIGGGIIDEVI